MEYTLTELCRATGFTKNQISKWTKVGILPEYVRVENKGGRAGKIIHYSEETLNRLLLLKNFKTKEKRKGKVEEKTINSLVKKSSIGIPGIAFLLWLHGIDDNGIRNNVRKFFKQSARNLLTTYQKFEYEFQNTEDEILSNKIYKAIIFRIFSNLPKKEIKKLIPKDTSNETYDKPFEGFEKFCNKLDITDNELLEDSIDMLPKIPLKLTPIKNLIKEFDSFPEENFKYLQASTQLIIGILVKIEVPIKKILSDLFKANILSLYAILGFYVYKLWIKPIKQNSKLKEEFLNVPENLKEVSNKTIRIKKIKLMKNRTRIRIN